MSRVPFDKRNSFHTLITFHLFLSFAFRLLHVLLFYHHHFFPLQSSRLHYLSLLSINRTLSSTVDRNTGIQSKCIQRRSSRRLYFLPDTISTHHHPLISLPPIHCTTLTPMKVPGNNIVQSKSTAEVAEKNGGQDICRKFAHTKSGNGYYYYIQLRNRCPVNGRQTQGTHLC